MHFCKTCTACSKLPLKKKLSACDHSYNAYFLQLFMLGTVDGELKSNGRVGCFWSKER